RPNVPLRSAWVILQEGIGGARPVGRLGPCANLRQVLWIRARLSNAQWLVRDHKNERAASWSPMREQEPTRKLTAILCADAAGYSRMMRADEEGTYRSLRACRDAFDRLVGEHHGRIFGAAGDSVLAEFPSPVEAVRCAAGIQQSIDTIAKNTTETARLRF